MRRRLFTLLSALSLLLCVGTCALWVRSYSAGQDLRWSGPRDFCWVVSEAGMLQLEHATFAGSVPGWSYTVYPDTEGSSRELWKQWFERQSHGGALRKMGFAYNVIYYNPGGKVMRRWVFLPHWAVAALAAILPASWLCTRRLARKAGTCQTCGYDLRGNVSGTCPECGGKVG